MGGRRSKPEEKASAVAMYVDGVFITEIARRTGFGTTTVFRWAREAGVLKPFSDRLTAGSATRQFGREVIGKKGAFHTTKGGAWIHTDSTYEYARLEQLESLPCIVSLDRCRDRIAYVFDGVSRTYIPDFKLVMADGSVIVEEVKPARWVADPKVRAKIDAAMAHYRTQGVMFRVVTEEDIGVVRIKAASASLLSRNEPDHTAVARERRRQQKAVAQRAYTARKRAGAAPDELHRMRAQNADFQRKYRAAKREK